MSGCGVRRWLVPWAWLKQGEACCWPVVISAGWCVLWLAAASWLFRDFCLNLVSSWYPAPFQTPQLNYRRGATKLTGPSELLVVNSPIMLSILLYLLLIWGSGSTSQLALILEHALAPSLVSISGPKGAPVRGSGSSVGLLLEKGLPCL